MVLQPDLLFGAEVVRWTVLHLRPDKQDNHDDNEDLDDDGDDEDNEILDDIVAKIMIILILMIITRCSASAFSRQASKLQLLRCKRESI